MTAIAEFRDVYKTYTMGDNVVHALDGVSVTFNKGDFWAIMGPSGSGKSTMLNLLGCLDRPTSGDYVLGDHNVSKMTDRELSAVRGKMLGFVFQSFNLIQQLSVIENIEVPLFYQHIDAGIARKKALEMADLVGLADRADHRPAELSGGQQQRVAIARALVNEPLLILADEPTGNLDSRTGEEIMAMLKNMHKQGTTVIMVTHEEAVAANAEHVIAVRDGKITSIRDGAALIGSAGA